jgi:hypothetical protein
VNDIVSRWFESSSIIKDSLVTSFASPDRAVGKPENPTSLAVHIWPDTPHHLSSLIWSRNPIRPDSAEGYKSFAYLE